MAERDDARGDDGDDLIATYKDMNAAREAIKTLERAGVDGSEISLVGEADRATRSSATLGRDERVLSYAWQSSVRGGLVGAGLGTVLGLVIGVVLNDWNSGPMWATLGGGMTLGAALGILLGGIVQLPQSDAGLATVETDYRGRVALGIHVADPSDFDDIAEAARRSGAVEVETVAHDVRTAGEPDAEDQPVDEPRGDATDDRRDGPVRGSDQPLGSPGTATGPPLVIPTRPPPSGGAGVQRAPTPDAVRHLRAVPDLASSPDPHARVRSEPLWGLMAGIAAAGVLLGLGVARRRRH